MGQVQTSFTPEQIEELK